MISFDYAPSTAGMTPMQLEFSGQFAFSNDKLVSFVPFIMA